MAAAPVAASDLSAHVYHWQVRELRKAGRANYSEAGRHKRRCHPDDDYNVWEWSMEKLQKMKDSGAKPGFWDQFIERRAAIIAKDKAKATAKRMKTRMKNKEAKAKAK